MTTSETYSAFEGSKLLCQGLLKDVVLKVKRRADKQVNAPILIFSDATGNSIDFNLQGSESEVVKRLEIFLPASQTPPPTQGPGRPKLGVVSREVSLLPRHWEWLAAQSGGASATIRKLIEEAKKKTSEGSSLKQAKERAYKFMSVLAGDREGYEEALRALYREDKKQFQAKMADWPEDVRHHAFELAKPVFAKK